MITTPIICGPAFLACELACSEACWPFWLIPGPGLIAYMACMTPCTALCIGSCFSYNTNIITQLPDGSELIKNIDLV